jgi:mannose-6-phosphate isomerase-like protein (cupin superfamily)
MFETRELQEGPDALAPDGMHVRLLLALAGGGVAHFALAPGETSVAVRHRTVEEIWYFLTGHGVMWRQCDDREEEVSVGPGVAITIPVGTHFQVRSQDLREPLTAVSVTMPPWPGHGEAIRSHGKWPATVSSGAGLVDN